MIIVLTGGTGLIGRALIKTAAETIKKSQEKASAPRDKKPAPAAKETAPAAKETAPAAKDPAPAAKDPAPAAKDPTPAAKETAPAAKETGKSAPLLPDIHKIHLITRDLKNAAGLPSFCEAFRWPGGSHPFPREAFPKSAEWGVIHLAGEPLPPWPWLWTRRKKARIYSSRIEGAKSLAAAIRAFPRPPRFFLSASAAGIYGDQGAALITEKTWLPFAKSPDSPGGAGRGRAPEPPKAAQKQPPGSRQKGPPLFLQKVCLDWEKESLKLSSACRTAVFRFGAVLAKEGFLAHQAALAKKLPFVFSSKNPVWMSWIHIEDAVRLLLWGAASESVRGIYNGTSPGPVPFSDFSRQLSQAVRPKAAKIPVPLSFVKFFGGEMAKNMMAGCRALPEKALRQGFKFNHPGCQAALRDLLP